MTTDSPRPDPNQTSWLWRWLLSLTAAQVSAGLGLLFPQRVWRFYQTLVWNMDGRPTRWPDYLAFDSRIVAAFVAFTLGWIAGLFLLACFIVIRNPRPRW